MLLNPSTSPATAARVRRVLLLAEREADAALIRSELSASRHITFDVLRVTGVDEALLCLPEWSPDIALLSLDLRNPAAVELLGCFHAVLDRVPAIVIGPVADDDCMARALRAGAQHCVEIGEFSFRSIGRIFRNAIWKHRVDADRSRREPAAAEDTTRFVEASADAVVLIDGTGVVRFCNTAASRMFAGITDRLVGREFGFPVAVGGRTLIDVGRADGTPSVVEMCVSEITWESAPARLATLRDVTETKRVESLLRRRERELSLAQRVGGFGSWQIAVASEKEDFMRLPVRWSVESRGILGLGFESPQLSLWDICHAQDRPLVEAALLQAVAGRSRLGVDFRIRTPGRLRSRICAQAEVFEDDDSPGLVLLGTIQDITMRAATEVLVRRLNRIHSVLAGMNSLGRNSSGSRNLCEETCRLALEEGGMRAAWVAGCDGPDSALDLLAARAREAALLQTVQDAPAHSIPDGDSALRCCIESREILEVRNDSQGIWILLPLAVSGRTLGVLALLSGEDESFAMEELALLERLSMDLAFALDNMEQHATVERLSMHDTLTGLANRTLLCARLASTRTRQLRRGGGEVALAVIDLERFRSINGVLGLRAGDELLCEVARRLASCMGGTAELARIGNDCFALLLPAGDQPQLLAAVARVLDEVFDRSFSFAGRELRLAARAGVATGDPGEADMLIGSAEVALRHAKQRGERVLAFRSDMNRHVAARLGMETGLRQALRDNQFVLHYQPIVEARGLQICGMEALLRWQSPDRGLVPPAEFIPLLEETGLIREVGAWSFSQAAQARRFWAGCGIHVPRVAVNVSPLQLNSPDFAASVRNAVAAGESAHGIDIEVTESVLMEEDGINVEQLRALRALGLGVALDDFGTGFSSLRYLSRLPVTSLKVDRSFVADMLARDDARTLVGTMISLAHAMRLRVTAEGVETREQAELLRSIGCDQMQGYYFGRPVPLEEMTERLKANGLPGSALEPAAMHMPATKEDRRCLLS